MRSWLSMAIHPQVPSWREWPHEELGLPVWHPDLTSLHALGHPIR